MGRIVRVIMLLAVIAILSHATVLGTTMSWTFRLDPSEVSFFESEPGLVSVTVEGYNAINYLNYPPLPYRIINVLIPQGEVVESYRIVVKSEVELDASIPLAPYMGDYLEDGRKVGVIADREEIVGKDAVFPRWRAQHLGSSYYRDYRLAAFAIYPFRYDLNSSSLTLESEMNLIIETEPTLETSDRLGRMRYVAGFRESAREHIESMVINPEVASIYAFNDIRVDQAENGFAPSYFPSMEGSEVAYVIVTSAEMSSIFQVLADWKTKKGIPTVIRTVEWIQQNYRSGADRGESIRTFIQEAYAKWGVEWVLLAGDTDIIPARYAYCSFFSGAFIPTDMYFSCLDGTWNADGDSVWGETYHSAADPGDDADLYSEVYVGRMPASTYQEAEILVNKALNYAAPYDTISKEKFLILAEVIYPDPYHQGDSIYIDGAEYAEQVFQNHLESNPEVITSRLYESYHLYAGTRCLTLQESLDSLSAGSNQVLHIGHGNKYNMSVGDRNILNFNANQLTNGDALYSMYLMNCTNVAFDTDCLAEHFMLNSNGGAFAVTGSSRAAFPFASRPYMYRYYDLLFADSIVKLGKLHTMSRILFTPGAFGETADRWTHFIYNYLGDPEISLYQGAAKTFTVSKPGTAVFGSNDLMIQVMSGGAPYDSALVCLYKEGDDYAYGFTDVAGMIVFYDFLCKSDGIIDLTVTAPNHCRYMDHILVLPETSPYLRITRAVINDNIVGNGDDKLDAGETVGLSIKLKNTGQSAGEKLYAIIRSSDASVTVIDSTALFPDIPAGSESYGSDGFSFNVASEVLDEQSIEFVIDIYDSTGGFWSESFAFEVHAPELELFVNVLSDTIPYGNNNGFIENGETFLLKIGIKNFGTGSTYGLQGRIRSLDGDIVVTDSISTYSDVPTLGKVYGDGFVLTENNIWSVNYYTFELTDQYGRTLSKRMELRAPGSPHGIVLDASLGPTEIHVTWHPPDSLEAYQYFIYHSLDSGGPYELASMDHVFYTLFRDYDLLPSTVYYYVVTTVDSCGNEGLASSERSTTTSPPQLSGWPNTVGKETASSPKIADIDGDTYPDIVVGAELIYAWHADGTEMVDGDDRPVTWGVLSGEGDNYTATVALADLDGNPGKEIVGASWNTREIYVFDHDGNTLPGWPQDTSHLCWASPLVGDLDGDSDLEVIVCDIDGIVYVWHHDGTEMFDGDDDPATNGPFFKTDELANWHVSTPALADIDEDGISELIICAPQDSIYCLNEDASSAPGWPVSIVDNANLTTSPAVGDIDEDGHLEVVVINQAGRVIGLNHDGTSMTNWPVWIAATGVFFPGSPALADLTGDGKLEVIVPSMDGYCHIFRADGSSLPNWPQAYAAGGYTESSPTIADLDNDGSLDIILGSEEGRVNAWSIDGQYIAGFPIMLNTYVRGTPMVQDLDLDGDIEIVGSCWNQNIYVWDLQAMKHDNYIAWNGFHCNVHNNGWKEYRAASSVEEMLFTYRITDGMIELSWTVVDNVPSWNLHRREMNTDFKLLRAKMKPDDNGLIYYLDISVEEGITYQYRLEADDRPDLYIETDNIDVPVLHAHLYQNHPNPFNPSTMLPFTVPGGKSARQYVQLAVYDVRGTIVKTLAKDMYPSGRHSVRWDGRNNNGESVASGIYFARLSMDGFKQTRKLVLLR